MGSSVLGVSAFYHDSAACLVDDGAIIAAAQEERFSRRKNDDSFPTTAVSYCLAAGALEPRDLSAVVFYENPHLRFDRMLETWLSLAPKGLRSFSAAMRSWLGWKLFVKRRIHAELASIAGGPGAETLPPVHFAEHHQSHAASAYYPSGFARAAVLCLDGVGEWATTSAWVGDGNALRPLWEIRFPHSLGLLYSAFTYHAGFRVNSGEYKLMGLAPYGTPRYVERIYRHLIDVKEDGSFRLDLDYFDYCTGRTMTNDRFSRLFDGPPRAPDSALAPREMDLARSIQVVVEDVVLRLARSLQRETGATNLCLAGGVALNCVANGRLLREGPFERIWVQPAPGDAGGALGAALAAWHRLNPERVRPDDRPDLMSGALLGPSFTPEEAERFLRGVGARFAQLREDELLAAVVGALASGKVVGWFQGQMEFGPRALGARSILADPRSDAMQEILNLKIKRRESFRPFAPAVLRGRIGQYFELDCDSAYMQFVAPVRRTDIPAVTHVDGSARVQTVDESTNPRFYRLLERFHAETGCAVLVNTSFNVRDQPIVCTPEDAFDCFMHTEMDMLVIENCVLYKDDQDGVAARGAA